VLVSDCAVAVPLLAWVLGLADWPTSVLDPAQPASVAVAKPTSKAFRTCIVAIARFLQSGSGTAGIAAQVGVTSTSTQ